MTFYILLITSLRSLRKHPLRSLLTTLGVIIGVIAIITVTAIGSGAETRINKEIKQLGSNFIILIAGSQKNLGGPRSSAGLYNIKKEDIKTILNESEYIDKVSPAIQTSATTSYSSKKWKTIIAGVADNYADIREWPIIDGSFFTEQDVKATRKVAVLGQTVAKELFGDENPINQKIRIKGSPYIVVGVFAPKGKLPNGMDQDDSIFAPYSTIRKKLMGVKGFSAIILSAKNASVIHLAAEEIRSIMRQRHKILPGDDDDFTIFSQDEIAQAAQTASKVFNILLLIIASISLIVGGIGIMNIMLVTVTERKKEIGIRMAIGATTSKILNQFILEAIAICLTGGIIGVIIGSIIATLIGILLHWSVKIAPMSIYISLISSTLVGIFFGYYPAKKAANLNPVEALADK